MGIFSTLLQGAKTIAEKTNPLRAILDASKQEGSLVQQAKEFAEVTNPLQQFLESPQKVAQTRTDIYKGAPEQVLRSERV